VNITSENEVYQTQFREEVTEKFVDEFVWRNGDSSIPLNLLFHCTHQIFINHGRSAAPRIIMQISRPSLQCLTHLLTIESLMTCSPYTSQSWRWMSAGLMFLAFKKQITDRISYAARFSNFWNIVNTQDDA
jgi:hypothetical protein